MGSVPPQRTPKGIRFGTRLFSEPIVFRLAALPALPGLYAVLVCDSTCAPRPYRVIYFGQAGDLAQRVTRSHEKHPEWCRTANGEANLYLAYDRTLGLTERQQVATEEQLIQEYTPQCNVINPLGRFLGF